MDMNQNLSNLMKEAQKMQKRMQEAQEELTKLILTGDAGGGLIKVKMNGRHDVTQVVISPELVEKLRDEEDVKDAVSMLEDLFAAAVNNAVRKIEKESQKKIQQLTAGLNIPTDLMKSDDDEQ